ncbi:MAG TPA: GntR family transcriptional regulator [Candidatus Nitrosocosmicus sp.]|nr:GntR family transcriptional regulator [Candidatus Nitrosocosmicus sp.]
MTDIIHIEKKLTVSVNLGSSIPKYIQVVNSIIKDINSGNIKGGEKIPSINELSHSASLSRDTIEKAYKYLKNINIIHSVKGVGYFTTEYSSTSKLNIFFLINKSSSYKMEIYNSFVETMGSLGNVSMALYYCDEDLFESTLKKNIGLFDFYVIMPHFKIKNNKHVSYTDRAFLAIKSIPKDKLILLDNISKDLAGIYGGVYQDFEMDIFKALEQALKKLKNYEKIILVFPNNAVFPYPELIVDGFKTFCFEYNFNCEIINEIYKDLELESKDVYITIQESDLVNLVQQVKARSLILGKDIGVISYNDTPLKSLLDITVISTDFKAMGYLAADLILSKRKQIVKNEFKYIERNSL